MIILLHTSKTMRIAEGTTPLLRPPQLLDKAKKLDAYLKTLSPKELEKSMHLSPALAKKTHALIEEWTPKQESPAIDSFIGDIYSGLQANNLSAKERDYADKNLYILSGLYGILKPYDGISPYRLELIYKFPSENFANLYKFWGESIANCLPKTGPIANLTSDEYAKTITPFIDESRLISPHFLTINPKTNKPGFVAVHAKIARGAFARWMIINHIKKPADLKNFNDLNYIYDKNLSTDNIPTFICKTFGGLGRSIRLTQ